jgi:hypothetical protein
MVYLDMLTSINVGLSKFERTLNPCLGVNTVIVMRGNRELALKRGNSASKRVPARAAVWLKIEY